MPLSTSGIVSGQTPIRAAHNTQYFQFITGQMTDQPGTFRNTAQLGGNQGAADHVLTLLGVSAQTGSMLRALLAEGDAQPAFRIDKNGKLEWGAGGASAPDTSLERSADDFLLSSGGFDFVHKATPSAPSSGQSRLYFKSDGQPYFRSPQHAAGAETALLTSTGTTDPVLTQVWT